LNAGETPSPGGAKPALCRLGASCLRALLAALLLCLYAGAAGPVLAAKDAAKAPSEPGAYCPFPKQGEKPACFAPVEKEYSAFFASVDAGDIDEEQLAQIERELESAGNDEGAYMAVSSLAYGYYLLAERAAKSDEPDPALVERLNGLNDLLAAVYDAPNARPEFRVAVRAAAEDLRERSPAVPTPCEPGSGGERCETTGTLLRALKAIDDPSTDSGVRGALGRLLERVGGVDDPAQPTADTTR